MTSVDFRDEVVYSPADEGPGEMTEAEIAVLMAAIDAQLTDNGKWLHGERASRTTLRRAVEAVNRGAARLDVYNPTWMDKINMDTLALASGQFCVLGQVYGAYDGKSTFAFLGIELSQVYEDDGRATDDEYEYEATSAEHDRHSRYARKHGFLSDEDVRERNAITYPYLDVLWVNLLSRRAQSGRKELLPSVPTLKR